MVYQLLWCSIFVLICTIPEGSAYKYFGGYLYWYPHLTNDNTASGLVQGSINIRTVWNISSFIPPPTPSSCATFEFSKGELACQQGCLQSLPPVKFKCTEISDQWVAGQMIAEMPIEPGSTIKLVYSGIDWPDTVYQSQSGKTLSRRNDEMTFLFNSSESREPPYGSFPFPIVNFDLGCYDSEVFIPAYNWYANFIPIEDLEEADAPMDSRVWPSTSRPVMIEFHRNRVGIVLGLQAQWKKSPDEEYENIIWQYDSHNSVKYYAGDEYLFKFQTDTGFFPISLHVTDEVPAGLPMRKKRQLHTQKNHAPIQFLLNIVGQVNYTVREKGDDKWVSVKTCQHCDYEHFTIKAQEACIGSSAKRISVDATGHCKEIGRADSSLQLSERFVIADEDFTDVMINAVTPKSIKLDKDEKGNISFNAIYANILASKYGRAVYKVNGSSELEKSKIVDFIHLRASDKENQIPTQYLVTKIIPDFSGAPLEILNFSPVGNCKTCGNLTELRIQFNKPIEAGSESNIGNLIEVKVLDGQESKGETRCLNSQSLRVEDGNTLVIDTAISFADEKYQNKEWFFQMRPGLAVDPLTCDPEKRPSPAIIGNTTWRIFVPDITPPTCSCGNYSDDPVFSKTLNVTAEFSEKLTNFKCILADFDNETQPQEVPCDIHESSDNENLFTILISDLDKNYNNRSMTLILTMEDMHGNKNNGTCVSFFVDNETKQSRNE